MKFQEKKLSKAKQWFIKNNGSAFMYIDVANEYMRDSAFKGLKKDWQKNVDKSFDRYCHYNISIEKVNDWSQEIAKLTLVDIENNIIGYELYLLFVKLNMLEIPVKERINPVIEYLRSDLVDTFTAILLCEIIIRDSIPITDNLFKTEITDFVLYYVPRLLSQPISIDESYMQSPYMKGYDFSDNNIKQRISNLLMLN